MKIYKLDLLTLLIGLFILAACNNPDDIGLEVDSSNGLNTAITETSTVKAFTVPEEKILTNTLTKYPLGYFIDPVLGTTQAAIGASLNLPSTALTFGTNPVLDSAVLVMNYAGNFEGDSLTSTYHFSVHQLSNKLDPTVSYYNDTAIPFNSTEIGSLTLNKIRQHDSVWVKQIITAKPDTLKKVLPHIRIPIDPPFINTNFLSASTDKFLTAATFANHIKGLYIKVDQPAGAQAGGIAFFDMSSGGSKLELYYRNVNAKIDTNYVVFDINTAGAPVIANFTHNYTGTAVQTQLSNPSVEYTKTFTQGLSGVRTKITFPDLANLKQLGNIVINKAELIASVEGGSDLPFAPASRLVLYRTDIADQRKPLQDLDPYDGRSLGLDGFGGVYNSTNKTYTFNVTAYIQDILLGKAIQYATYLAPADLNVSSLSSLINPSGSVASKAVLGSGISNSFKMKLRVKYTLK